MDRKRHRLWTDWKLSAKMMAGFAATAILTLGVGGLGAFYVQQESSSLALIYQRHVSGIENLKQAQIELLHALSGQKNALVAFTPEQRESNLRAMTQAQTAFAGVLSRVGESVADDGERQLHNRIEGLFRAFSDTNANIAASLRSDQADKAFGLSNSVSLNSFQDAQEALGQFVKVRKSESDREYQSSMARNRTARISLIGLALVGGGMGLLIGLVVARSVARPLKEMVYGLQRLEAGDLSHEVDSSSQDEVGELAAAYNSFTVRLRGILSDVQAASRRVGEAVARLSSSAAGGHRAGGAAGTLTVEETAEAMATIAQAAESNAALAADAASQSANAHSSAQRGREAVSRMVQAVTEINESSRKISQIVNVMDEIALQTNLLALNAAVEAAHAGEEGKGFAVVASEVRRLAQRSAEAAKEIAGLIEESTQKAGVGRELATRTGNALQEMADSVDRVNQLIGDIARGSSEQREAMRGATVAISAIDRTMQQNAREVESLRESVSYFRV